jgi:hypothetical protein
MSGEPTDNQRPNRVTGLLGILFGSDLLAVIARFLLPHLERVFSRHQGMYEVLAYEAELALLDGKGNKARLTKHQQVRFLQDNIIAYQDQAWGDGNIFAEYRCTPGIEVDRYRDGHRYRILISLRETKNRGDVEDFHIERVIERGFTKPVEDFQIDIDHKTRKFVMSVIFPKDRPPKSVKLIEQTQAKVTALDRTYVQLLPDGRCKARWETSKPQLGEDSILRWEW